MKINNIVPRGFTIVELLVVISVIGILASIGIVSYSGSQNRAKKESFNSTAQQAKLKLGEYFTDKNRYPSSTNEALQYFIDSGSQSLRDTIVTSGQYVYTPLTSAGVNCSSTPVTCQSYTLTVSATNWKGAVPADNIVVKP